MHCAGLGCHQNWKSITGSINALLVTFLDAKINPANALALNQAIYGLLLILFINCMPRGIIATLMANEGRCGCRELIPTGARFRTYE